MLRSRRVAQTSEERMFDLCDRAYPKLSYGRCCQNCLSEWRVRPAQCIHHIIHRNCLHLRFNPLNLIPLSAECHQKIHDGKLTEAISEQHREKLQRMSQKDIKSVCLLRGITKEELYTEQYKVLKSLLLT